MNEAADALAVFNAATESRRAHNCIFDEYRNALNGAGPKLKELILDRAAHDRAICLPELRELVKTAYPDGA